MQWVLGIMSNGRCQQNGYNLRRFICTSQNVKILSETHQLFFFLFSHVLYNRLYVFTQKTQNIRIDSIGKITNSNLLWLLVFFFLNRLRYKMGRLHDIFVGCWCCSCYSSIHNAHYKLNRFQPNPNVKFEN